MQRYQGKVALVTGGASGLGRATAKRLASEGAKVVLTDRQAAEGARAAAEIGAGALFLEQDVPYYASNRDLEQPDFCELGLYPSLEALQQRYLEQVSEADVVIVGSYVQQGVATSASATRSWSDRISNIWIPR